MSVLRVFLTADSEFAIENVLKLKGKPEINAREKSTLFLRFFVFLTGTPNSWRFNFTTTMCGIKNYITYVELVNFGNY
jgi:hypothetical protein